MIEINLLNMILAPTFSVIIAYFWKSFIDYRKNQKDEIQNIKNGLQSLLRYRIILTYNEYKQQGWIPLYAYEAIVACYESYENLGANGVIDDLMDEIRELPRHPQ